MSTTESNKFIGASPEYGKLCGGRKWALAYSFDYYIAKFSAIPEEEWSTKLFRDGQGRKDALGHCGYDVAEGVKTTLTKEGKALRQMFWYHGFHVISVNDGKDLQRFSSTIGVPVAQLDTPKKRVIAAIIYMQSLNNRTF